MRTIAVVHNRGGIGKTSLVHHLAWMYAELDWNVLVADLDPQANLTSRFLEDDDVETLWLDEDGRTIHAALRPLLEGRGDALAPWVIRPATGVGLVAGDLLLSGAEDEFSSQWAACLDGKPRAVQLMSAFSRAIRAAAEKMAAELVLLDVGSNLSALTRAALLAADSVVVPLAPDVYALRGLQNLGPTLRSWRRQWADRRAQGDVVEPSLPEGAMRPVGYVVLQHAVRLDRPWTSPERWLDRIPGAYRRHVLGTSEDGAPPVSEDAHCLGTLKHFRSLMPLAQEARKPMFLLRAGDGALGGHAKAVADCHRDFRALARRIEQATRPG